jgi:NRPS condensation-like uncharacterized protein
MGATAPLTMPATFVDCFVYFVFVRGGILRPQLGLSVTFADRIDDARMARALRLLVDSEPVLGCRFVPERPGPEWRRIDPEGLECLLDVRDTSDPEGDAATFVAAPYDPCAGPQIRGTVLRGSDHDTLVLRISHIAVDGVGVKEAASLLADIYRRLGDDPAWVPAVNSDGVRDFRPVRAGASKEQKRKALSARSGTPSPTGWDLPDSGRFGAGTYLFDAIEPSLFEAMRAAGRVHGATVNDVIVTAYYRSLFAAVQPRPDAPTPMNIACDLRGLMPEGTRLALGNIAGSWTISVSRVEGEDFEGTLERVVEQTTAVKGSDAGLMTALGSAAAEPGNSRWRRALIHMLFTHGAKNMEKKRRAPGTSDAGLSNIGVIDDGRLDFGTGVRVGNVRLFGPMCCPQGIQMTACTFRDRLELCVGFDATATDPGFVRAILSGMVAEIEAWAAT